MVAHKTLFVQPTKREPILIENLLKKGKYKQGNAYPVLHFTDVGEKLWETARQLDKNSSIIAVRSEASLDWSVSIKTKDLKILAHCSKYKVIGYKPEDCVLTVDINGKPETITSFSHAFATHLEKENIEINDWKKFSKYTGVSKDEVKTEWREIVEAVTKENKEGVIVAKTEDEILTSFRSSDIIYKVKIENKLTSIMSDIHIKPIFPVEFSIDNEEQVIPNLEEGQSEVVIFNLKAEKEHEGVDVSAEVTYKDSESDEIKKLQMKTRYVGRISKQA